MATEQKDDLGSVISKTTHDLRNCLITIHGITSILQEEFGKKLGERGLRYLERIRSNVERMEQQLVELSKSSKPEMR